MQNWDDYRLILAINDGKTLRNAAKQLGVNHSTVSRRLASLNSQFGADVAEPTSTGLKLTPLGKKLLQSAQSIASLVIEDQRFERAVELELEGDISVSVPPPVLQFLLLEDLLCFQQTHPGIRLNIHASYDFADLDTCEADVVIRVSDNPGEHLSGHRLFPVAVQYYGSQTYLENTPEDQYQWITNSSSGNTPDWIAYSPLPDAKTGPGITDLTLRHQAASAGYGLIRGACYIAAHYPNLRPVSDAKPRPFMDMWVLSHPDFKHIKRIQVLKRFLLDSLRAKEALITGQSESSHSGST